MVELGNRAHAASPFAIFTSPREAFIGVREKPRTALIVLLMLAFAVLPGIGFAVNVDAEQLMVKQMRATGQWEQLPDEQREQALKIGPKFMTYGAPVGGVVARLAWILVVALLGWAMLRGGSEDLKYGPCVAAVALACAPLLFADVLICIVYFVRDPRLLDATNPIASNPAAWFSLDVSTSALGAFLRKADLFELWSLVLAAIGLNVVARRKSWFAWLAPGAVYVGLWIAAVINVIVAKAAGG